MTQKRGWFFNCKKWLIVSPHADDAELGCGGIITQAIELGIEVHIVVAVIKSEWKNHKGVEVASDIRKDEFLSSSNKMGCSFTIINETNDSSFDLCSSNKSAFVGQLDQIIEKFTPDIVFIPIPSFHQEHQWVYECCLAATRPYRNNSIKSILAYEYPPSGWGPSASWDPSKGGVYVDITETLEKKLQLLEKYETQLLRDNNSSLSIEAAKTLAKFRGMESRSKYAELFYLLRSYI